MPLSVRLALAVVFCGALAATSSAGEEPPAEDAPAATYDGSQKNLHVYLLIGQSNMAGRAPVPEEDAGVIPQCYLLNGEDEWEPARNPLNRYSTVQNPRKEQRMNPGYAFARRMLKENESASLGLVANARGGSSIEQWNRGTRYYQEALRRTREAAKSGTLKGILWHQGEDNSGEPEGYTEKLNALVTNLREDLKAPNLPFVAGQIYGPEPINEQIAALPETTPATGYASSEGLKVMDRWHFDAASMKRLGTRYAEAMLKVQAAAASSDDR